MARCSPKILLRLLLGTVAVVVVFSLFSIPSVVHRSGRAFRAHDFASGKVPVVSMALEKEQALNNSQNTQKTPNKIEPSIKLAPYEFLGDDPFETKPWHPSIVDFGRVSDGNRSNGEPESCLEVLGADLPSLPTVILLGHMKCGTNDLFFSFSKMYSSSSMHATGKELNIALPCGCDLRDLSHPPNVSFFDKKAPCYDSKWRGALQISQPMTPDSLRGAHWDVKNKRWKVSIDATATQFSMPGTMTVFAAIGRPKRLMYMHRAVGDRLASRYFMYKRHSRVEQISELFDDGRIKKEAAVWLEEEPNLLLLTAKLLTEPSIFSTPLTLSRTGAELLEAFHRVAVQASEASGSSLCVETTLRAWNAKTSWIVDTLPMWHLLRWLQVTPPGAFLSIQSEEWFDTRRYILGAAEKFACFERKDTAVSLSNMDAERVANGGSHGDLESFESEIAVGEYALATLTILHRMLLVRLNAEHNLPVIFRQDSSGTRVVPHLQDFNELATILPARAFAAAGLFTEVFISDNNITTIEKLPETLPLRVQCHGSATIAALRPYVLGSAPFPFKCRLEQAPPMTEETTPLPPRKNLPEYVRAAGVEDVKFN